MRKMLEMCLTANLRKYPDGYGFSLGYLRDDPGVFELNAMLGNANAIASKAILSYRESAVSEDVARFVSARASTPVNNDWAWWLIEAAQLVHANAIAGNERSAAIMVMWQHPGY